MRKNIFLDYVRESDFRGLFISEMGWNNYKGQEKLPLITIDETDYQIREKYKWSTEGETKLFVDIVFVPKTV